MQNRLFANCLFVQNSEKKLGEPVILYTKDLMEKDGILHLPLYMAMFL